VTAMSSIWPWRVAFLFSVIAVLHVGLASAEEKSYYSPIIEVNAKQGYIVISADGRVFGVVASPEAKPHLDKLPVGGMLDLVVEVKPGDDPPEIKRWHLMSGESSCKVFDGKSCK